jgi:hypothetical protein
MVQRRDNPRSPGLLNVIESNRIVRPEPSPSFLHGVMPSIVLPANLRESYITARHHPVVSKNAASTAGFLLAVVSRLDHLDVALFDVRMGTLA